MKKITIFILMLAMSCKKNSEITKSTEATPSFFSDGIEENNSLYTKACLLDEAILTYLNVSLNEISTCNDFDILNSEIFFILDKQNCDSKIRSEVANFCTQDFNSIYKVIAVLEYESSPPGDPTNGGGDNCFLNPALPECIGTSTSSCTINPCNAGCPGYGTTQCGGITSQITDKTCLVQHYGMSLENLNDLVNFSIECSTSL